MMTECHGKTKTAPAWNRQPIFFQPAATLPRLLTEGTINPASGSAKKLLAVRLARHRYNLTLHTMVRQPCQQVLAL